MTKLIFSKITRADLKRLVQIEEKEIAAYDWTQTDSDRSR
jgi:hypothetical protein